MFDGMMDDTCEHGRELGRSCWKCGGVAVRSLPKSRDMTHPEWGPIEKLISDKWAEWMSDVTTPGCDIIQWLANVFRSDEMQALLDAEKRQERMAWEETTREARHQQMLEDGGGACGEGGGA